jgi:hypothetical protein
MVALLLAAANLSAGTVVNWVSGGPNSSEPAGVGVNGDGYRDGDTILDAEYHTPCGIAMDSSGTYLFVADRDNNAIRYLELVDGWTWTFDIVATNLINKPISVAIDNSFNVYVLNCGNGKNGTVVEFNNFGELQAINATGLTNAGGMALDSVGDIYVTASNALIRIIGTNRTTIATIPNAGASLQGIVVKRNGLVAACDSGRNGIYLIDPATGIVTTNAGFHGAGDFTMNGNNTASSSTAKFNQPMNVAETGDGTLIVTDFGNHRVKRVLASGVVTNLYGVNPVDWVSPWPGFMDGTVKVPDLIGGVAARSPYGVVFAPDGTVYTTEDYYHIIRRVTGAGLTLPPPPPPPVPAPQIGWVSFPPTDFTSVFNAGSSFVFNNDVPIVIVGTNGSQTFYTYGATPSVGSIPDPTAASFSAPVGYVNGLYPSTVNLFTVASIMPDLTIKAIGEKTDGSPNSAIVQARFQFVTANPRIVGNNAALFTLSDITVGSYFWYSIDGVDPTNSPGTTNFAHSIFLGTNSLSLTNQFSLSISSNFTFKVRAFKNNYQPSAVVSMPFSPTNFAANRISFGVGSGEPASKFQARPGQFFYAPVTLSLINPSDTMYSLQFNAAVTNGLTTPNKIVNGAGINFFSMLMTQVTPAEGDHFPPLDGNWYLGIPNVMFTSNTNTVLSGTFVNTNNNLIGVDWSFRTGFKYSLITTDTPPVMLLDFDTAKQDLITYSIAHDTLFKKANGVVVLGAYSFLVPTNAITGDQYFIQLGSPSATRDGVGAPGASIYIQSPANSQAVTVTNIAYLVGDAAPFHWLNAGDFGDGMLDNSDVQQVFQSAVELVDMPPMNSDLFLAMDSSGRMGVFDGLNNYYTDPGPGGDLSLAQQQAMYDGNDLSINSTAFGDGVLDVSDVYVTLRRSLDPSLTWWQRYWTNGQFVAVTTPNLAFNSNNPSLSMSKLTASVALKSAGKTTTFQQPSVSFSAGDALAAKGQTIQLPISANIFGNYPLRVLGLNITIHPLDGSPALIQSVQFIPAAGLGQPQKFASKSAANYSAAWYPTGPIDSSTPGLSNNVNLGTLTVTIPTNATSLSAYAIHFDHASASPNGIISFPRKTLTGLITLSSRTNSSYGDGIPDSWRLRYFFTTNNLLSQASADADGDGLNNRQEYLAGTDPMDPTSFFKNIGTDQGAAQQPNDCVINWSSVSGKQYVIERSSSLVSPIWTAIATNSGTGTTMEYHDTSGGGVRYYRVRVQ